MLPQAGEPLTADEFEEIMEVVKARLDNFPNEPPVIAMWTVIANIGDKFAPVACIEQEWTGLKQDIPKPVDGENKCPNGHPIDQVGPRLSIGWILDEGVQTKHRI